MTHLGDDDIPRDEIADRVLDRLVSALPPDAEMDGDRAKVARGVEAALLRRAGAVHAAPPSRTWMIATAAVAAVIAVSTFAIVRHESGPSPEKSAPPVATVAPSEEAQPKIQEGPSGSAPNAAELPTAAEMPTIDVSALPTARSSAPSVRAPAPAVEARSAAELFAMGNDARRKRDVAAARALYVELQAKFPKSAEAITSYVTLGRLELDHDRSAEALAQFDRYLGSGASELREDALAGRASALERLGRASDEKQAWQALLAAYPGSLFAAHARQRLTVLP